RCLLHTAICFSHCSAFFFSLIRLPLRSTLFPYTTLFRSLIPASFALISSAISWAVRSRSEKSSNTMNTVPTFGVLVPCNALKPRSEEHTSELQSRENLVCRLLLEKKKKKKNRTP